MMQPHERVEEFLARNEIVGRKIRMMSETTMLFKRDVHSKRLQKEIGNAIQKLTRIYETAQKELNESVDYCRVEFLNQQKACSDRAASMQDLLVQSHQLPESELQARLSAVDAELKKAKDCIDSFTDFDITVSPELSILCKELSQNEKAYYIENSIVFPWQVDMVLSPSTTPTNDPAFTTVKVLAVPTHPIASLDNLLVATLDSLNPDEAPNRSQIRGVAVPLKSKSGSVRITFSPVPAVGEYIVKVLLYGKPVNNSPMVVRLTVSQVKATAKEEAARQLRRTQSIGADIGGGGAVGGSSLLCTLANRARAYSGSGAKQVPGNGGAAVASKRPMPTSVKKEVKHRQCHNGTPV